MIFSFGLAKNTEQRVKDKLHAVFFENMYRPSAVSIIRFQAKSSGVGAVSSASRNSFIVPFSATSRPK